MGLSKVQKNTVLGFAVSVVLAGVKFAAGILGHSTALIADAVESLADTVGSVVVWQALRVSQRPADAKHPYGYGKAEALAGLCVGVLMVVAAGVVVWKALELLTVPHAPPHAWTLLVLLLVIVVKELLFRLVLKGAKAESSDAARADAWHHRADAITSLAAGLGVGVAILGPKLTPWQGWVAADEIAAILSSGVIVWTAVQLIRPALAELLDESNQEVCQRVRKSAEDVPGVKQIEKIHARKSGRGFHIDMHMHVDGLVNVRDAHDLSGKVKAVIRQAHKDVSNVLIHIEPFEEPTK